MSGYRECGCYDYSDIPFLHTTSCILKGTKMSYSQAPLMQQYSKVKPHRGLAIAAFVLAVVGAIFGLIPLTCVIAIICGVIALIFGLVSRAHGMGKAGIVIGIVALALGIWGAIIVNSAVNDISNNVNDYNNCIQNAQTLEQMSNC